MSRSESGGFYFSELDNGWEIGRFQALNKHGALVHAVTTRRGPDPTVIASDPDKCRLGEVMHLRGVAWCGQVHGRSVLHVDKSGYAGEGDAMVTNVRSLGLMMRSADCPLILVADPVGGTIGIAHASWRGTVRRIASQLIVSLSDRFGTKPQNIIACIGPSAGPCCYNVGPDVHKAAIEGIGQHAEEFFVRRDGRTYFDLWSAGRDELTRAGVRRENIHFSCQCTICNNDRFPSHRVEGRAAGRFATVLAMRF